MFELDSFLYHLKSDTQASILQWNNIHDSWDDDYCSIDFRMINPSLFSWTDKNPFIYNNWRDVFVANIMTGFVFVTKQIQTPPLYALYLQPDAHSKMHRLSYNSSDIKELYDLIQQQLETTYDEVSDFIYYYINSHTVDKNDE